MFHLLLLHCKLLPNLVTLNNFYVTHEFLGQRFRKGLVGQFSLGSHEVMSDVAWSGSPLKAQLGWLSKMLTHVAICQVGVQ